MKRLLRPNGFFALFFVMLTVWGCGSDEPGQSLPITVNKNVIYKHGDMMKYDATGAYTHADGSKSLITGGWLRLEIYDEGLTNPNNGNVHVLTLLEAQSYDGANVDTAGRQSPVRFVNQVYRYFIQDPATGTIEYQGERLIDGYDATGAPVWKTFWFVTPTNYVQYQLPLVNQSSVKLSYQKTAQDGSSTHSGNLSTLVQDTESVSVPLGKFDTYKMKYTDVSSDPASPGSIVSDREQYIYPDIGIVKFVFNPTTPGDTGSMTLALSQTNIAYQGGSKYNLSAADLMGVNAPGNSTRYTRSGFYMSPDGTVEEISGWFTMDVLKDTILNPVMNKTLNTLLETHYTETKATDIAGNVTVTSQTQAFKRYYYLDATNSAAFAGDTAAVGLPMAGQPIWFDKGFVPMAYPYFIGETHSQTINVFAWMNNAAVPLYSFTPTMAVVSTIDVATALGTFNSYLMTYLDSNGKTVEQYSYPKLGVVKFRYPAPAGKIGYMDVTVSSTNVPYK